MQLKKMLAMAVVTVMAAALCVPAMAEEATPGEIAGTNATVIKSNASDWNTNKDTLISAATEMTAQLSDTTANATINQEMSNAGLAFFVAAEKNKAAEVDGDAEAYNKNGVQVKYSKQATADALTINSCTVSDTGVVTLDATQGDNGSAYGYAIAIVLPDDTKAAGYRITMTGEGAQPVDMVAPVQYSYDEDVKKNIKQVTFWVPHFTTYELQPVSVTVPTQPTPAPTVTVTSEEEAKEETAQPTPTPVVAENPIKKTGTSMNLSMMAVVAVAAVAACGAGVAVKKSHKGE